MRSTSSTSQTYRQHGDDSMLILPRGCRHHRRPGSFCSGADLHDFLPPAQRLAAEGRTEHQGIPMSIGTDGVLLTLDVYKPIIAAIDGPCLAGGMDLLGGTDIRLATPEATFGLPEPKTAV